MTAPGQVCRVARIVAVNACRGVLTEGTRRRESSRAQDYVQYLVVVVHVFEE